jgi:hypothetical protein
MLKLIAGASCGMLVAAAYACYDFQGDYCATTGETAQIGFTCTRSVPTGTYSVTTVATVVAVNGDNGSFVGDYAITPPPGGPYWRLHHPADCYAYWSYYDCAGQLITQTETHTQYYATGNDTIDLKDCTQP